jgi:hypothetical protein
MSQEDPQPDETDLLRTLLAGRDMTCPVCAYNLRGNESRYCPECSATLELQVGSADLRLGPWLMAPLGLALRLGFVGIYAVFGLVALVAIALGGGRGPGGLGMSLSMMVPALICAGYAFLLWRLVRRRRKFWSRPRRAQWRSAVLYAVIGPGSLIVPLALIWLTAFL